MFDIINYLSYNDAISIHDEIIAKSGGSLGVIREGLIRSPLEWVKNDKMYPSFTEKVSHLFFSFTKNHGFVDGNKRSAISICAFFMLINFYEQEIVDRFIKLSEELVLDVANEIIPKDLLKDIFNDVLISGEISDLNIIKIYNNKESNKK